jgi:hypothetical protein
MWMNNNCESSSFVLKVKTEWKQCKLVELIEKVQTMALARYGDIRKALTGQGPYYLDDTFKLFPPEGVTGTNLWPSVD